MTISDRFSRAIAITGTAISLFLASPIAYAQPPRAQTESVTTSASRIADTERHQGPFLVSGHDYFVVFQSKCLSRADGHPQETLVGLKVLDAGGYVVRQESFPYEVTDGGFSRTLTASAALLAGMGGSALAIEFFEARPDRPLQQSWMLFGVVNNRLERFGMPLPVGQGDAVGGVVNAVMVQGGLAVVPMASKAEAIELPVWAGSFYAGVPVRMNWAQVQWSQGIQCFAPSDGTFHEDGCNMQVEARLQPGAEFAAVLLSPEPRQNTYTVRYVPVRGGSKIELLGARGIVSWQENEGRVECHLSDVWLSVRINGAEGWVHSSEAFAALGLPADSVSE